MPLRVTTSVGEKYLVLISYLKITFRSKQVKVKCMEKYLFPVYKINNPVSNADKRQR